MAKKIKSPQVSFCRLGEWTIALQGPQPKRSRVRVAFNIYPKLSPFGGAQEFLKQLASHLVWQGCEVVHELDPRVTHIVILEPRWIETTTFGIRDIASFKKTFPETRVILRVNNCDKKYGDHDYPQGAERLDDLFLRSAKIADEVVFISEWLRNYFMDRGFDPIVPNQVIHNAANDLIFFPRSEPWDGSRPLKLVTHHWSDNRLKGFKEYQELDQLIERGDLADTEFTVIGRWPKEIAWRKTKTLPPLCGTELADELRRHDVYFTASRWEPGGMHFIEGMQCGLPVLYHEDGGGIVEVARRAGIGFRDNIRDAVQSVRHKYNSLRGHLIDGAPSGALMVKAYSKSILPEGNQ